MLKPSPGFRPWLVALAGVTAALVVAAGLLWFQPWKLLVDETVDEAVPAPARPTSASTPASTPPGATGPSPAAQ